MLIFNCLNLLKPEISHNTRSNKIVTAEVNISLPTLIKRIEVNKVRF